MATVTTPMRKLLNDPADVVKESLAGLAAAHGDLLRYDAEAQIVVRADAPCGQGRARLGRRLGPRAAARRVRRARHARRRVPGRGVHLARARADARRDEGGRRRRGRRAHRQELHRRRHELQARGGGRRGRGDRRRVGADRRRRRGAGLALHRGPPRRRARRCSPRRSPAPPPSAATTWRPWPGIARRVNERSRSFGVALSSCTPPAAGKPIFDLPEGEMEVGIGIHGEPGRARASRWAARREIADAAGRGRAERPRAGRRGGGPAVRQRHGRDAADRAVPALRRGRAPAARARGCEPVRRLVGSYITSLEMAGASLTLLELDDELPRCGMLRSTPRRCAGGRERGDRRSRRARHDLNAWLAETPGRRPSATT